MAFVGRLTYFHETYSGFLQQFADLILMLVFHLNHDTRIFGKQNLNNIFFFQLVEAYFHTPFNVGKTHFK
ncbi:hypothetical protein SDC9_154553 [bioreactor metagenome]|uniref:Uncharacterized protein n=1 Tax=bioreactor metagenome TaxID=1076179 RepID=A0A645EZC7_9ZZZZ